MANALCILYLLLFLLCGLILAHLAPLPLEPLPRCMLGLCFGLFLLIWLPALLAFLLGFTVLCQWAALLLVLLPTLLWLFLRRKSLKPLRLSPDGDTAYLLFLSVPFLALCGCLLYSHILWPAGDGALCTGQSCFGDMPMHLAFVTSISRNGRFPPLYSIQAGTPMGYPFLCDSVSSTFLTLGASLRAAYILPMVPALFLVFGWFFLLMRRMLGSPKRAALAFLLFFLGGGFGFAYFFDGAAAEPGLFTRIFTAFYETPTNLVEQNVRWVNPICDMLLPQRATLFGWALLLPCLYLLLRAGTEGDRRLFVPLGLLAGGLPLLHTHSFLALAVLSAGVLIWQLCARKCDWKGFLVYALLAAALALPQLLFFTLRQASGEGFLRFSPLWANESDGFFWFYIKNWGLIFLLLPFAVFNAGKKRGLFLCSLPLWAVCELVVFQPNPYDNNKLIFVCYMLACGLVADLLCTLYRRLRWMRGRGLAAGMVLTALFLSGTLTIGREIVSGYELFSAANVRAASFAADLPKDAVLLTADEHNNPFASLSGLTIVQGSPSFLYYHGVYDEERAEDVKAMYTKSGALQALAPKYGVTHVVLGPSEWTLGADETLFDGLPLIYDIDGIRIYSLEDA